MNKLIYILGSIFLSILLLISFVSADWNSVFSNNNNLKAYYNLNESTGGLVNDASGLGNNGIANSSSWVQGIINTAINTTIQRITINNASNLTLLNLPLPITFSFWVYPNTTNSEVPLVLLDAWANPVYLGANMFYDGSTKTVSLNFGDGGSPSSFNRRSFAGSIVLKTGSWTHIVGIINNATNMTIYINGTEDSGGTFSGTGGAISYNSAPNRYIGQVSGFSNFAGVVDEIGIWNRTLTTTEVTGLYNSGTGITFPVSTPMGNITVTLLTPANNTLMSSSTVNFTANAMTNGTFIKNMSLWLAINNNTFVGNQSATFTGSSSVVDQNNLQPLATLAGSNAGKYGMKILTSTLPTNTTLVNVTKAGLDASTHAYLLNSTLGILAISTFVGNISAFNYQLASNTVYYVAGDGNGASVNHYYTGPVTFPLNNTYLNWTGGLETGADNPTQAFTIRNLTLVITASSTTTNTNASFVVGFNGTENVTWNFQACDVNGFCQFGANNYTLFPLVIYENSKTFSNSTFSGNSETFILNITYSSTAFTGISSSFVYNNTVYSTTTSGTGDNILLSATLNVPTVLSTLNKSFYWNISLTNNTATQYYISTISNQTIFPLSLDNCSTNPNRILNLDLFDEDSRNPLNGTIQAIVNIYVNNTNTLITTFNGTFNYITPGPSSICISNITTSYGMDYQFFYYGNASYFQEYKYGRNISINNATRPQNISLYDILVSTGTPVVLTVRGTPFGANTNLVIDVQRQYVSLNQFISVESPLTDANGNTIAHLVSQTGVYNFLVLSNGTVLGTFNNMQADCAALSTTLCTINLNLASATATTTDFGTYYNVSSVFLFDSTNRTLQLTYQSVNGLVHTVLTNVSINNGYGNSTVCSVTGTGTSGTLTCNIPQVYGNSSIYATRYIDGNYAGTTFFTFGPNSNDIFYGVGVILAIFMYTSLVLLFMQNPFTVIIGALMGMGFATAFLFFSGGGFLSVTSAGIYFLIAGAIIIYRITR